MKGLREEVLELVPADPPGITINTLACRLDVAHYIVRGHLGALVSAGEIVATGDQVVRYHRNNEEANMRHYDTEPLSERILEVLPHKQLLRDGLPLFDQLPGWTILRISRKLQARPNNVSAALGGLIELEKVVREGAGKRGDPYVHYRKLQEDVTGPVEEDGSMARAWVGGSELDPGHEAGTAKNEAPGSPQTADLEAPDTLGPPDPEQEEELDGDTTGGTVRASLEAAPDQLTKRPPGDPAPSVEDALPDGYTDAPEILAARVAAQEPWLAGSTLPGTRPAVVDRTGDPEDAGAPLGHEIGGPRPLALGVLEEHLGPARARDAEAAADALLEKFDHLEEESPEEFARRTVRAWSRAEALALEEEINEHLAAGVPLEELVLECHHDGSTVRTQAEMIGPAIGYNVAAIALHARAEEARWLAADALRKYEDAQEEAEVFGAAAKLLDRLRDEELDGGCIERVKRRTQEGLRE